MWERKAAAAAGRSVFAALSTAASLAELEAKQAAFPRLPSVSDVQSVLSVLPDQQAEKLADPRAPRRRDGQHPHGRRRAPSICAALTAALETLKRRMDLATRPGRSRRPARGGSRHRPGDLGTSRTAQGAGASAPSRSPSPTTRRGWRPTSPSSGGGCSSPPGPTRSRSADLPEELRRQFIGKSGRLLLQIYSRLDPWDHPSQARFVEELRTVDRGRHRPAGRRRTSRCDSSRARSGMGLAYAFVLVAGDRGAHDPPVAGDRRSRWSR